MKIGIIGAENSHTAAIASMLNVDKRVKGFSVEYVWGETSAFAKAAAEKGQIPNIVKKPEEMMGKIDALIVDHRHAKYHLAPALPFVKKGIPTFIDKPFCYRAKEGRAFLAAAKKGKAPVTSFSVLPHQKSAGEYIKKIKKLGDIKAVSFSGPSDLKSKYGGLFFYGIHQVDIAIEAYGLDISKVLLTRNGDNATAQLLYKDGKIVTINLIKEGVKTFSSSVTATKGNLQHDFTYDPNGETYLTGIKTFCKMFKTGKEPLSYDRIMRPVEVLEALEKSLKTGKVQNIK